MSRRFSMLVLLFMGAMLVGPVRADDGWSLAKLNPFQKKKSSQTTVRARVDDQLADARARSGRRGAEEPSTWAKMTQGTKDFFGKTKNILLPWTKDDQQRADARSRTRAKTKSKKGPSILTSWLYKEKEPPRPRTVPDFLDNDRPGF